LGIALTSIRDGKKRHSSKWLDFNFKIWEVRGGKTVDSQTGKLHVCNEHDFKRLYPVKPSNQENFEDLKKQEALMCMDEEDENGKKINFKLFGQFGANYRYVEMNVIPCKPEKPSPENAHRADTSCVYDVDDK
jgi:hypothetical protein